MEASLPPGQQLWRQCLPIARQSREHPFVQGIGSGAMDKPAFQAYIAQDAFFLQAFAKAYAHCLTRCETEAHLASFSELIAGVVAELKLHKTYAQEWGVDLAAVQPNRATAAYTGFLLQLAREQPIAIVVAGMLPCMQLYAWLGQGLAEAYPDAAHAYAHWITAYSSAEFAALAAQLEALFNDLCAASPGTAPERLLVPYRTALRLEYEFFDAVGGGLTA